MPLHSGAPLTRCRTRSVASVPSSAAGGMAGLFERSGSAAASVLYLVVTGACLLGLLQLGGLLWGGRSGLNPCKPDNEVRCGGWALAHVCHFGTTGAAHATLAAAWKAVCIRGSRVAEGQGRQRGGMSRQGPCLGMAR